MIASVGNGWPVQRTDMARVVSDLLTRADNRASGVGPTAGRGEDERHLREEPTERSQGAERKTGNERQVGDELAAQLKQSRLSRTDGEARHPVSSLDTNNQHLDRVARQATLEDTPAEANAGMVGQLLRSFDTAGDERMDGNEFAVGIDRIAAASTVQAGNTVNAEAVRESGVRATAADSKAAPADLNRDGAVGPQELATHQTRETQTMQAAADAQQQRQATERIATRLAQTYGRFDPEIANATLRVNPFYVTA